MAISTILGRIVLNILGYYSSSSYDNDSLDL